MLSVGPDVPKCSAEGPVLCLPSLSLLTNAAIKC